jgi:NitT/TauT family transport system substrate-binding protein
MSISRRQLVTASTAIAGLLAGPRFARAQAPAAGAQAPALRPLTFGTGVRSISALVINTLIGEGLGYNREEGFTLRPLALGTNANVQVAVDKGDAMIGIGVPSYQLPLFARGELPPVINFYEYTYPYKWDVAVRPDSPIQRYEDLRGKRIGVSDLGATDYPVTRMVLRSLGIDPDRDAQWIAVGAGVPAGVALQRGSIDALAYFDTGFGQIAVAGIALRFLPRPPSVPLIGGQFLMTRRDWLGPNRALAVGFGRSVAKASEFLIANPRAGAKAFLEMYPETAPRGSSQADAIQAVVTAIGRRLTLYRPPYPGALMGSIQEAELRREAEFAELRVPDVTPLFTNDLIADINRFDVEAVRAAARTYPA